MGSICKCQTFDLKSCQNEITITSKNTQKQEQRTLKKKISNSFQDQNLKVFYIVYPKNENDFAQLFKQLEVINKNEQYEIEEYYQESQGSQIEEIESYFNLNGLSVGSFKQMQITSDKEQK
ncbi:unnamed protein product (macronuclear) [Paramecium tetraurelia]|uniref:Uncharacterized protein n=1 Tax=Paramecium tetraurelia TaxID=5888 RepID=A0CVJ1_PARTE|nr:uncharacterized protein GSPATT00010976001 [Paramecium tetraurelia]CAK74808.1 unnamed protein product [Paramecium tetraurelia]|eukprot:XP_001442205.1 hypothetical protein (macronuclear) [Paramecium tetraurelia strain d4-2]